MIKEVKGFQVEGLSTVFKTKKEAIIVDEQRQRYQKYKDLENRLKEDFPDVLNYILSGLKTDFILPLIEEFIELRQELVKKPEIKEEERY